MSDLIVTVPKDLWREWIAEGDAAGDVATGTEWGFFLGGKQPPIGSGDRLYIAAHGRLRGYAPVTRLDYYDGKWRICRKGDAVAVTIDQPVQGFQGWRHVWWKREQERPFPHWRTDGIATATQQTFL